MKDGRSVIRQELDVIQSQLLTTAGHIEGLANNALSFHGREGDELRNRFRAALRENAAVLNALARRLA